MEPPLEYKKCSKCGGTGKFKYTNTGTYIAEAHRGSGMIVGRAMTWDTCSHCWGSCDENNPNPSLLKNRTKTSKGSG